MTGIGDARYEDGADLPLRLRAIDPEDIDVISALIQDAVFSRQDCAWDRKRREFAILLSRFRWEDRDIARSLGAAFERVRSVLLVRDVLNITTDILNPSDADPVFSLLSLRFQPDVDGMGILEVLLAGDMDFSAKVECLDVTLTDVSQPYRAPSGKAPSHR